MRWNNPSAALITGATSGIGEVFARQLAGQGFKPILVARRKERLEKLAIELQQKTSTPAEVLVADLANQSDIERVSTYITKLENLDVLVNCAGFATTGCFINIPLDSQLRMMLVHNITPVYFCRSALPIMTKRDRGAIINVSSIGALMLLPHNVIYSATKSFLKTFTEALALELQGTGIRVQVLCPGFTRTEFHSVGDFQNFDRSRIPNYLWMFADEVVEESLKAFRKNKVVVIPGRINRLGLWIWKRRLLGKLLRARLMKGFRRKPLHRELKETQIPKE